MSYTQHLWEQYIADFLAMVAPGPGDRVVVAGNSIGALAALYAASTAPEQCRGLCLVNSAGNFEEGAKPGPEKPTLAQKAVGQTKGFDGIRDPTDPNPRPYTALERAQEAIGRIVATGIFYFTKVRIKTILEQVYEYPVDDELVRSIALAADFPSPTSSSPLAPRGIFDRSAAVRCSYCRRTTNDGIDVGVCSGIWPWTCACWMTSRFTSQAVMSATRAAPTCSATSRERKHARAWNRVHVAWRQKQARTRAKTKPSVD